MSIFLQECAFLPPSKTCWVKEQQEGPREITSTHPAGTAPTPSPQESASAKDAHQTMFREKRVRRYFESLLKVLVQCVTLMKQWVCFEPHKSHTPNARLAYHEFIWKTDMCRFISSTNLRTIWGQFWSFIHLCITDPKHNIHCIMGSEKIEEEQWICVCFLTAVILLWRV